MSQDVLGALYALGIIRWKLELFGDVKWLIKTKLNIEICRALEK